MGNRKRLPRKPTSMDVARAVGVFTERGVAGVHRGRQSCQETRERILKVADKIGYVPEIHARTCRLHAVPE